MVFRGANAPALSIEPREGPGVRVPASALKHAGFRAWVKSEALPPFVRATFVRGEILIEMSPESLEAHNKVKKEVTFSLERVVRDDDLGEVYMDGTLYTNAKAGVSTEPDLLFVSWETLESGRVSFVEKADGSDVVELVGTPDLVVEIVSDSSVRKDLTLLREAYARARVPEYWVVDARGAAIRFEILRLRGSRFVASAKPDKPQRSAAFGRSFVLTRAKNRVGTWSYRLRS